MIDTSLSVAGAIARAAAVLAAADCPEPRREALRLWSGIDPGGPPGAALLDPDAAVSPDRARRFVEMTARRASGEPLAYVTGWTGFRHLVLRCDRRALIPRPETEGLVEHALARVRTGTAVDVGTGTGAIALALRAEGAFDEVIGVDISSSALQLAHENGAAAGLAVTWLAGDLLAPLAGRRASLVVSNPPYLSEAEYDSAPPSVRDYEPSVALVSGNDGLDATRRLLGTAREVLAAEGWIALELDARRAGVTAELARAQGWVEITVIDDLFGRARYLLARRGADDDRR